MYDCERSVDMGGIEPPWQIISQYLLRVQLFYVTHAIAQNSKDNHMRAVKCNSYFLITAIRKSYPPEFHRVIIRRMMKIDGTGIYANAVANEGANALTNAVFTRVTKFARTLELKGFMCAQFGTQHADSWKEHLLEA